MANKAFIFSFGIKNYLMRSVLFFLSFLFLGLVSKAQQYHFAYLQTDNKQPFYIRLNEKLYSSSTTGYVIIPKLAEGKHTLSIGFPKNAWPVQNITISIANKDLGFLIKNFDSKGWGLFNLQTMEVITSSMQPGMDQASVQTKTDAFSNVLADVVNTPSIKNVEEKKDVVKNAPVKDEIELKKAGETVKEIPAIEIVAAKPSLNNIQKISSAADAEGVILVYQDKHTDGTDTIALFIPRAEKLPEPEQTPVVITEISVVVKDQVKPIPEEKVKIAEIQNNPKFIDITLPNPNANLIQDTVNKTLEEPITKTENKIAAENNVNKGTLSFNSDCKKMATEQDFLKIRKKMTSQKSDDQMVEVAKKFFKEKCYSTEQIKNLSVLFLKDEGKYKLFDAAYPYVYDTPQYKQLENQLSDQYVISRFRAMIRN